MASQAPYGVPGWWLLPAPIARRRGSRSAARSSWGRGVATWPWSSAPLPYMSITRRVIDFW